MLLDTSLRTMSRRAFLKQAAAMAIALGAAACGATPTPTPVPPTATKPPAAAPTATTAPAAATAAPAAATATKPAAAPTTAPAAAATAKPAGTGDLKSVLIGKLEGPTVIEGTIPPKFNEAPDLAALVKAGKLPPVAERIGSDPLVIKPVHGIGKYGGTWRRAFTGPGDNLNGARAASGTDDLVFWDYTAQKIVPNIAKALEMSADGTTFTFRLRRGMKWSDGSPFTADDILFWYEDYLNNKDLTPTPTTYMTPQGKMAQVTKVDDYTVVFKFATPYYMFPRVVAGTAIFGQAGGAPGGGFMPKKYLMQFHSKYVAKADLDKKVADLKFDNWVNLFRNRANWNVNPEVPVVSPWKTTQAINTPQWVLERNPYSIWVDTEGNQLPYIDKIVMTLAENLEVLNLRAIAGELDMQARHIALSKLPVLIQNQEKGNYKVRLDTAQYGADLIIWVDLWYQKDKFIGDLLRNVEFRRAMSIAINRDELNETFWLGTGTPGNALPHPDNPFSPGPEWRQKWAQYDVKTANAMLDKLGIDKKDAQGFRLRPDGSGRVRVEIQTKGGQFLEYTAMAEMIKEHWAKVGIETTVKEVERALGYTNEANNETQFSLWTGDGSDDFFLWTASGLPTVFNGFLEYFNSFGAKGKENQPDDLIKMTEIWWKGPSLPDKERADVGKEFWKVYADSCIQIGVVGLGAAAQGVRVTKNNLGNVPDRMYCTPWVRNPAIARPQTFYWKS